MNSEAILLNKEITSLLNESLFFISSPLFLILEKSIVLRQHTNYWVLPLKVYHYAKLIARKKKKKR